MSDNEEVAGEPWLTTSKAARRLDPSAARVRQLGRAGRLDGPPTRFGRLYAAPTSNPSPPTAPRPSRQPRRRPR
jgi:hypothetical protein